MKKRIALMAALALAPSLSACAPAYTAGGGDNQGQITLAKDIFARGAAIDMLDVRPDTPPSQFVRLPDCESVAYWGDVQRVGVAEAARQCLEYDRGIRTFLGGVQIIMLIAVLPALFYMVQLLKVLAGGLTLLSWL